MTTHGATGPHSQGKYATVDYASPPVGRARRRVVVEIRTDIATDQGRRWRHAVRMLRMGRLQTALTTLPDLDQEVVRLVHWEGLSLVEVAGVLRRRQGRIRSRRYHRARMSLKRELESAAER